jgi:hypothetical protein
VKEELYGDVKPSLDELLSFKRSSDADWGYSILLLLVIHHRDSDKSLDLLSI